MISYVRNHPLFAFFAALFVLVVLVAAFPVARETDQGVVVRFGKPERIINPYVEGQGIGGEGAGLTWRIPFAEDVVWIDKRVRDIDMDTQLVLSTDQLRLEVDAFARYRITDPLQMYVAAQRVERVEEALRPILGSQLRNELGKRPFASLLSPEREGVMENIRRGLDAVARQYGAEIIDVRIKRADLPDGSPLDSAFERMRTAREQEARAIRAQGQKQAQIIRAEADADAARTYAASFGQDPDFYDFYRAMQSYRTTFVKNGDANDPKGEAAIVLSPDNEYFREFTGR
ncbi:protease modulator HflC [Sphingomicrobium astaxanthinifaciens]|uniref:protease modulator HflC n=1 Tax=Sphingomicrobium astaxanthinifaciens TaxID=1227949 RepID=UPI001FCA833D|nr:protease modulator HflC [Sphingomicrobium astaxanthinifaciens]MCJ7421582.1 protease modulator HflC [Sphingomicrobium astaxanthinifaciens]